jgi:uncharacterized membrane protein
LIVAAIVGCVVVIPVISYIVQEANLPPIISPIMSVLPIFMLIAFVMLAVGLFPSSDEFTLDEEEEDEAEEEDGEEPVREKIKKAKKSAYEILAERYARGEITDEQYTEAMSRL